MKKSRRIKLLSVIWAVCFLICNRSYGAGPYFSDKIIQRGAERDLIKIKINGPPRPPGGYRLMFSRVETPVPDIERGINIIPGVPAFSWSFGCSATSAAMIAGYYDRIGYDKIYTGPTNGGFMPLDNSVWPSWKDSVGDIRAQCPLSAGRFGLDGRTTRGHVDDYWIGYGKAGPDPFVTEGVAKHRDESIADFMSTNQWVNSDEGWNTDGSTVFYNFSDGKEMSCSDYSAYPYNKRGDQGLMRFFESRGYKVETCYTRRTDNDVTGGFSFVDYKKEIDEGRPVMFHVRGHTMVGVGYNSVENKMYIHDTWDYGTHEMTWGGSYYDMRMYSVTVIKLKPRSDGSDVSGKIPVGVYHLLLLK